MSRRATGKTCTERTEDDETPPQDLNIKMSEALGPAGCSSCLTIQRACTPRWRTSIAPLTRLFCSACAAPVQQLGAPWPVAVFLSSKEQIVSPIKSIVFCHGIWADGSCFSKLIPA